MIKRINKALIAILFISAVFTFSCSDYQPKEKDIIIYVKPHDGEPPTIWIWQENIECSKRMGLNGNNPPSMIRVKFPEDSNNEEKWYKYTIEAGSYNKDYTFNFKLGNNSNREFYSEKAGSFKFSEKKFSDGSFSGEFDYLSDDTKYPF